MFGLVAYASHDMTVVPSLFISYYFLTKEPVLFSEILTCEELANEVRIETNAPMVLSNLFSFP